MSENFNSSIVISINNVRKLLSEKIMKITMSKNWKKNYPSKYFNNT